MRIKNEHGRKFSYDGETFTKVVDSKYSHQDTQGLGNYKGSAITTGCFTPDECHVKTEILNMTAANMTWSDAVDYPYTR